MQTVELNIIALANSESSKGNFSLVLEETSGFRRLPIVIGAFEAQAIAVSLENMQTSRPMTHDLLKNTMELSGLKVKEVIISDLKDDVFYATIMAKKTDGELLKIDARTSDAIALAVRFGCPIFTTESILNVAGIVLDNPSKAITNKRGKLSDYSLEELERLLEKVLAKEDYESASKIRDAIKEKKES